MEEMAHPHAPSASPPGEVIPVPIKWDAAWAPEPFLAFQWNETSIILAGIQNNDVSAVQFVVCDYTDYSIPAAAEL
jgi:hypothetical protein